MSLQFGLTLRHDWLDRTEVVIGTSAILEIRSGAQPATCATADSGTLLASMALPADYFSAAAAGVKAKLGTWSDASANATGTAGHWRLKDSTGATTHIQGNCTVTGGGGDLTLDSVSITAAQVVTITSFSFTAPGA